MNLKFIRTDLLIISVIFTLNFLSGPVPQENLSIKGLGKFSNGNLINLLVLEVLKVKAFLVGMFS